MCGRYSLVATPEELKERFGADMPETFFVSRYNIAPTQQMPVLVNEHPEEFSFSRWGLIPFWAKDKSIGNKMINARAESVGDKAAFKSLLKRRRCLVPADSFYEWKKVVKGKQPYRIFLKDEKLFSFAGLWDTWRNEDNETIQSYTIITTEANALVSDIHDRMPVILHPNDEAHWLSKDITLEEAEELLKPFPARSMEAVPVSQLVNNPANDTAAVWELNSK